MRSGFSQYVFSGRKWGRALSVALFALATLSLAITVDSFFYTSWAPLYWARDDFHRDNVCVCLTVLRPVGVVSVTFRVERPLKPLVPLEPGMTHSFHIVDAHRVRRTPEQWNIVRRQLFEWSYNFGYGAGRLENVYWPTNENYPKYFFYSRSKIVVSTRSGSVTFPVWPFGVLSSICLALRHRRRKKLRMRQQSGQCVKCGYDLRFSPSRCPECGSTGERLNGGKETGT